MQGWSLTQQHFLWQAKHQSSIFINLWLPNRQTSPLQVSYVVSLVTIMQKIKHVKLECAFFHCFCCYMTIYQLCHYCAACNGVLVWNYTRKTKSLFPAIQPSPCLGCNHSSSTWQWSELHRNLHMYITQTRHCLLQMIKRWWMPWQKICFDCPDSQKENAIYPVLCWTWLKWHLTISDIISAYDIIISCDMRTLCYVIVISMLGWSIILWNVNQLDVCY